MLILDGKKVAEFFKEKITKRASDFRKKYTNPPGLAVVIVGDDSASHIYVKNKIKACEEMGIRSFHHQIPKSSKPSQLYELIQTLNQDPHVHGILVQMPVPEGFDYNRILALIDPKKDVDGLTYENMGRAWGSQPRVKSCTPQGVIEILRFYDIPIAGKNAVVIGRSSIVGKPMAQLLLDENATVTVCHSQTQNLETHTQNADIVVVAAGKPQFLGSSAFKKNAVVVDVGIHRVNGKLCGDVKFEELKDKVFAATPVPGGVGPMTIAMLMKNTMDLAELSKREE